MIIERNLMIWDDVVAAIRRTEEHLVHWQLHYLDRGYSCWAEWREATLGAIRQLNANWSLCSVPDPLVEVPTWHGGPFKGWEDAFYRGRLAPTFGELARDTCRREDEMVMGYKLISEHPFVQGLVQSFPNPTTVIAIRQAQGKITVIEGMHRCAAIAVAAHDPDIRKLFKTELFVAIGDIGKQAIPPLGHREK